MCPMPGARSLSLARTNAIGVVLPDLHGEFFSEIVRGMDRRSKPARLPSAPVEPPRRKRAGSAGIAGHARPGRRPDRDGSAPEPRGLSAALPAGLPSVLINTREESGQSRPSISTTPPVQRRWSSISPRSVGSGSFISPAPPEISMPANVPTHSRTQPARCGLNFEIVAGTSTKIRERRRSAR